MLPSLPKLGVNIDHIATLRQLRGTPYPDILAAAKIVELAGGNQITVHLREDRRHIQDEDVRILRAHLNVPLNLEMAASEAMTKFASKIVPDWTCLVPEKRKEVTTEGGLDVVKNKRAVGKTIAQLKKKSIKVSTFIEASPAQVKMSHELGADAIEFHTGRLCMAAQESLGAKSKSILKSETERLIKAALYAKKIGLHVHAGHGFDFENVRPIAALLDENKAPLIEEYNIGHAIVCRAALVGLERAVREMIAAIQAP
jgi:pyridoxine 5-phosphate synthase